MKGEGISKKHPPRKGGADLSIKINMKIKENHKRKPFSNKVFYTFLQKAL